MKLREIYDLAVKTGIEADPRGAEAAKKDLKKAKIALYKLSKDEKGEFDTERLTNPFADTRILYGGDNLEIKSVIAGIDVETPEILLADRLRERGTKIDLVLGHHPEASAYANLHKVMAMQTDLWNMFGVPVNVGDALMDERMREVQRGLMPVNKERPLDAARLLDIPFMCCHTPADNLVTSELEARVAKEKPETLKEIVDILKMYPEYKEAAKQGSGPTILVGSPDARAGKIFVDMTGGTGGPKKIIEEWVKAGVGTVIGMHMSEKNREEAVKHHLNVVIAGHIASDSIGLNLFLDKLEKKGVSVTAFSGLIRVKRI
jgi:hypothetical protein